MTTNQFKQFQWASLPNLLLFLLAAAFFFLSAIGAFQAYSPIPYYDMWDSYILLYAQIDEFGLEAFFKQHNEHRIALARILFFIDVTYFEGLSYFLIIMNYLLVFAAVFMFWNFTEGLLESDRLWISLLAVCLLFFWSQEENLTWAFQSQFFLAQLLPLMAFYFAWRSETATWAVGAALLCGILSVGSMANGILALPTLAAYFLLLRGSLKKAALFAFAAAVCIYIYYLDYYDPPMHGSPSENLTKDPRQTLLFLGIYFGSPAYFFLENRVLSIYAAALVGFSVLVPSIGLALYHIVRRKDVRCLAIVGYMAYLGLSACGVASGRVIGGLEAAVESRYTTAALFFSVSFLVLLFGSLPQSDRVFRSIFRFGSLIACLVMLTVQVGALKDHSEELFNRRVALLALPYQLEDVTNIDAFLYPYPDRVLKTSQSPIDAQLSVFALPEYASMKDELGQVVSVSGTDLNRSVKLDPLLYVGDKALRIRLTVSGVRPDDQGLYLRVVDEFGQVVGRILLDQNISKPKPDETVYEGYIHLADHTGVYRLVDSKGVVVAEFAASPVPFSVTPYTEGQVLSQVPVLRNDGWDGADYQKTEISGLKILGTFIVSDADTGELDLQLKRGDKVIFRSGPFSGGQLLQLDGLDDVLLPQVDDWVVLSFDNASLPDTFKATFVDRGTGLGQWSAIGVAK